MTKGKINGPGGAAEILDVNYGTLRHRMKKLGIPYGRGKPQAVSGKMLAGKRP
jgi:hypothetical protein